MAAKKKKNLEGGSLAEQLGWLSAAPKLPSAIDPKTLPKLEGTAAPIDPSVTVDVLRAMNAAKAEPGLVDALRRETTAESRDALGLALLDVWRAKEFHGRLGFVQEAIGALGGDRSTVELARCVAKWPEDGDTGRKRAIGAAPLLAESNTDVAILELMSLRQTMVVPSVLEACIGALNVAVRKRKTNLSELFDAITPTLGLDASGTRTFAHAGESFTVSFDDHFEPRLRNAGGDLAELDEDPAWKAVADQLRDAVKVQTFRLEQDMIAGRRWDFASWRRLLRDHPLLVSFTRRLVWGTFEEAGALVTAFRTAEDRTLLTRDGALALDDDACIGLVHPLHLDDATRDAWATHLADYEIIQPFPQLGRTLHRVEDGAREETHDKRFAKSRFKSGVLRDQLVRGGWERDNAFLRKEYERSFPALGVWAIATMEPGVQAGAATYDTFDQTIATVEFRVKKGGGKSREPIALGEVPPIAFSEAMHDVAEVLAAQE